MRIEEGSIEVEVPGEATDGKEGEVFYNPEMELNRDLTVATLRAYREREGGDGGEPTTYLDATAASGIRGVRAAADGWTATTCDVDPDAVELAAENFEHNGVAGETVHDDANVLMHQQRFDVVDVDPFGTPIPFADAAVRSAQGLLCVTATDTAPLCGAHFESGVRKYGAVPRNTEYHAEMGLRVLVSALVRTAAKFDVAARPVFSHVTDHYARTYLDVEQGARAANALLDELGHVDHCQHCLYREHERGLLADPREACPNCGHHLQTTGPIWLGDPHDPEFVAAVREQVTDEFGTADRARDLLSTIEGELSTPTHYDQHRLYKRWNESAVGMDDFLAALREAGYEASRSHYGGTTFKTTADVADIEAALH
jgi:tRNA (guanine26-N2/guanine27-N2)-dimethyltransferase